MQLLSVNVSLPKRVRYQGETVTTGIFKEPVDGRVALEKLGLEGDGQADLTVHGGEDKAVYVYTTENYDHWRRELARDDLEPGRFGENFTVQGMTEDAVLIGEVFRIGTAMVEVTQPRTPCFKLGLRMGDPTFMKKFLASLRVGFYVRVLEEGDVGASDPIGSVEQPEETMTVREICHLLFMDRDNLDDARRALRIKALSRTWRESFERRLAEA